MGRVCWWKGFGVDDDVGSGLERHRRLAGLHRLPQRLIDDPELRHLMDHQGIVGVGARAALAGIRVLHVAQAVPDQAADIELVVEDAGAARPVAVDGRGTPGAMARTGNAAIVEVEGDLARALAGGKVG